MKLFYVIMISLMLYGCVSGAPRLSQQQQALVKNVLVLKDGEEIKAEYDTVDKISAADCSGAPYGGRVWGDAERAIETLKKKAVAIDANGIINTSCSVAPFVNNCWAAKKCSGTAVKFK